MICKKCGQAFDDNFNNCPNCGESVSDTKKKTKKPIFKKWWFWLVIIIVIIIIGATSGNGDNSETTTEHETVSQSETTTANTENENVYKVGEVFNDDGLKISFISADIWNGYNQYLAPEAGNMIVRYYFEVENTADADRTVSYFDFSAYCDGKAVEQQYYDDGLSATLSSGRKTSGYVYFEVPSDATCIEAEYEYNYWSDGKVIFVAEFE